jgi:hypothetical protein
MLGNDELATLGQQDRYQRGSLTVTPWEAAPANRYFYDRVGVLMILGFNQRRVSN